MLIALLTLVVVAGWIGVLIGSLLLVLNPP
jgi:hypothetical protein